MTIMPSIFQRFCANAALAALLVGMSLSAAQAATKTWNGGTTDFNLGSNWATVGAPGPSDTATFTGAAGTQPTATALITVGAATFSGATATGWLLDGASFLTINGAITSQNTTLTNTITNFALGNAGSQTVSQAGGGNLILSNVSGTGGILLAGSGPINLAGTNIFLGGVTTATGTSLKINSTTALGAGTLLLNGGVIDNGSGGTLVNANNNAQTWNANVTFTGTNSLELGNGAISLGVAAGTSRQWTVSANTLTANGVISDGTTANSLVKAGAGTLVLGGDNLFTGAVTASGGSLVLNGSNAYTGSTTVTAGTLTLGGANGSILNTSGITLAAGTSLTLDNTGAGNNVSNRLANSQALTLAGSSLIYKGSDQAATNSSENMGALSTGAGTNVVTVTFGGTNAADLSAASFAHTAGQNTALINGLNLGANSGSTSVGHLFLTATPTLVGATAALSTGINSSAKDTVIVPYLLGEATSTTGGTGTATGIANTFLTYNATTGLRPLNLTDEYTLNAVTAGNNTRISSNTAAASSASINSLLMTANTLTINSGVTLTNASGAILFSGSSTIGGATGTLAFGSAEAMITVNAGVTATISSGVSTTSGVITKGGTGALNISGALTSTTGVSLYTNNAGATTLSSGVNGAGALTNAGVGTGSTIISGAIGSGITGINQNSTTSLLSLTNTSNAFVGPISAVSGSTLAYTGNGSLGAGSNAITLNNATLQGTAGNAPLSSTHSITLNGGGRVSGTQVIASNISGTGPLTLSNSGLVLAGNNAFSGGVAQDGSTAGRTAFSSNMNVGGASSALGFQNAGGTISILGDEITSFGSHTVTFGGGNSGSFTLDIQDPNNNFQFDKNMNVSVNSGTTTGALVKSGMGSMTFTTNQTFVNTTGVGLAMNGGNVIIDKSLGVSIPTAARLSFGGGTLMIEGSGSTTTTVSDIRRLDAGGGIIVVDNNSGSGTTTLALGTISDVNTGSAGGVGVNAGGSLDIRTVNPGSGAAQVTTTSTNTNGILGAGHVTFNGTSFATNTTNTSGGTVGAYTGATAFVGSGATSTTNYKLTGSGTVTASETMNTLEVTSSGSGQSLTVSAAQTLTLNTGGLLYNGSDAYTITGGTLKSATATNSDLIVHQAGAGTLTIDSVIANGTGNSTLTKAGTGTLVLGGTNTYTGQTYINKGTLSVAASANLGSANVTVNGGTLRSTGTFSTGRQFTMGGDGGRFDVADGQTLTLTNTISGGALVLKNSDASGTGILSISGGNTFAGGVYIDKGILQLGSSTGLNASGQNTLSFTSSSAATFRMNNFNASVAGLAASSTNSIIENGAAGAGTSTLTAVIGATNNTFAGVLRDNGGGGSGVLALVKEGAGTLNLTGSNSYTGTTIVNGGTMLINGANSGTGAVNVASGAVLGGGGSLAGATTVSGSLRPGNSIGALTISNDVTWNAGDAWVFELGGAASTMALANSGTSTQDQLLITGGSSDFLKGTGSSWTFDFNGGGALGWYKLVDWAGTTDFTAGNFAATNLSGALSGSFTVDATTSALYLNVVPEPSTWALLAVGLTVVVTLRRRRL